MDGIEELLRVLDVSDSDEETDSASVANSELHLANLKLLEHIGGFEKYELLPDDIKKYMLSFMSFKTRSMLKCCSTKCMDLDYDTPIKIYSMSIRDSMKTKDEYCDEDKANIEVEINLVKDADEENHIKFAFVDDYYNETSAACDMMHVKYKNNQKVVTSMPCEEMYYEEGYDYFYYWLSKSLFRVEKLNIDLVCYPDRPMEPLKHCKSLRIRNDTYGYLKYWLNLVTDLEYLELVSVHYQQWMDPRILEMDVVKNAKNIAFKFLTYFQEKEFLDLKAEIISVYSHNVIGTTLNAFIKKWANGQGVKNFKRCTIHHNSDLKYDKNVVLNGLKSISLNNDVNTEEEERDALILRAVLNAHRRDSYTIHSFVDSRVSATLLFLSDHVAFIVNDETNVFGTEGGPIFWVR